MSALAVTDRLWTFDDLDVLRHDVDWRRYEIVDGALVVSPSADMRHERIGSVLRYVLQRVAEPDFAAVSPMAVDVAPPYLIPI